MSRSASQPCLVGRRPAVWLHSWRIGLAALAALALPTGCDNVACVFGPGNCTGSGGGPTPGIGSSPATIPANGEWISNSAPKVTTFFPTGTTVTTTSPIVMIFSESLAPANLASAFEMSVGVVNPIPLNNVALVGDARVVVAMPATPLVAGTIYTVYFRTSAVVVDRVGRPVVQAADRIIGTFTTADSNPTTPAVLTTWPPTGSVDQSTTTEAVIVFDRAMEAASVNASTFVVTVGGVPPGTTSLPTPVSGSLGLPPDTRVFRYRSTDGVGNPVSLGLSKLVKFDLSPVGHPIRDTDMVNLPHTEITFTTAPFSAPTAARITSIPTDAIGIDEISGPADLAIQVDLSGSQTGDILGLYMFGTSQAATPNPPLVALFREAGIVLSPPSNSFTMFAGEINLLQSSSPFKAYFADGKVTFAFQVRRGLTLSPMRLLDIDTTVAGPQSPVLDTVPPQLLGLGPSGSVTGSFTTDLRQVALTGRSSEVLRGALVSTPLGDNEATRGDPPPVASTGAGGLFVAAPVVGLGLVPRASLPLNYTITVYDKALNASSSATGLFQQLGASGPGTALPGGNVEVDVFDAATLAPIVGAEVSTYQNDAGVVDPVDAMPTDRNGHASLAAAPSTGMTTIVTVIAPGFDLFTFDGVPTARLGVPLSQTSAIPGRAAQVAGTLTTPSSTIEGASKFVADSRVPEIGGQLLPVTGCTQDPFGTSFTCSFGPSAIQAQKLGAQAALAVIIPASPLQFSPATFLKAYQPLLPIVPAAPGSTASSLIALTTLLDDPSQDPSELPVDGAPATVLSLVNYPTLSPTRPDPRIGMEAKTPGIPGSLTVGQGVAYPEMPPSLTWAVRAAYPGAVEPIDDPPAYTLGRLAQQGMVEAPLMLRAEVSDPDGNIGGVRHRLPFNAAVLVPIAAAQLATPAVVINPSLLADDLTFTDVIPDAAGEPGIYRVTLTDVDGLSWTIYCPDPPDSAGPDVTVHLPYAGPGNVIPLAPGPVECQISAFAWPGFDIAQFLWTDIDREHDLYSYSAPTTIPMLP